jgi:N-formylglutamate deformylase
MKPTADPNLHRGDTALLISVPHSGLNLPDTLRHRMTQAACRMEDTDWYVNRLYERAPECGASMIVARHSRYVVDLNRPPDDSPLYGKAASKLFTGLVPLTSFSGESIYLKGQEPGDAEIQQRVTDYWDPYHQTLGDELQRIQSRHGYAILLDAHSIQSRLPLLFDGQLTDLNLGFNQGSSAAAELMAIAVASLRHPGYSLVVDGRFKGGYITRQYGRPDKDIHALQLEMSQACYMLETSVEWSDDKATVMQSVLMNLVQALIAWSP